MPDEHETPCDLDTLTWGYLDGDTTPERITQLEEKLRTSESACKTFVEHSQLHAMLHVFFSVTRAESSPADAAAQNATAQAEPRIRRRKRRGGKSSAA